MIISFKGKTPRIAASAIISKSATIIGDVEIGENTGVLPGATIRADYARITIGPNCWIEENSVIHVGISVDMEIAERVIIGHGAIMHGKKLGFNTLVSSNATILNDSEIGDLCVIAAGCVVEPGTKIPDHSFVVGVPGKIKEKMSPQRIKWLTDAGDNCVSLAREYRDIGF